MLCSYHAAPRCAVLVFAAACNSSNSTNAGPTGSLTVTITAPAGVTPNVTIFKPDSTTETISSTQTLAALPVGTYKISAGPGVTNDPIVSTAYNGAVTGNPASVTDGATATATVTYTSPRASSGILWVASPVSKALDGFSSANLVRHWRAGAGRDRREREWHEYRAAAHWRRGGQRRRHLGRRKIASTSSTTRRRRSRRARTWPPRGRSPAPHSWRRRRLAFDGVGDLWVVDRNNATLNEFTPSQLAAGGAQTPAVIVNKIFGTIFMPWQAAFDAHGDLWVVNFGDSTIVGYSAAQLAAGGDPVPYAAIAGSKGTSNCLGLAFDAQGNLWISTLNDTIVKFNASDLNAVGTPVPAVIITGTALSAPVALAFDNSGALWASNWFGNNLVKYNANQIASTGSPTPAVTISAHSGSLSLPQGMAFSPGSAALPVK